MARNNFRYGKEKMQNYWLLCFSLVCGVCTACLVLFVIGRQWSVIVLISGQLL